MKRALCIVLLAQVLSGQPAFCATEIQGHVLGSGGGTIATATCEIRYTLGESVAGVTTGTTHEIRAGFGLNLPRATAIAPDTPPLTPVVDRLYPNTPNPFNPRTTIHYDIAGQGGHVRLRIYDIAGRRVHTLVDRNEDPGRHDAVWDGRDDRGASVASGVYVYVLETPGHRFSRKMALLR